ncbi:unnamed protein product [Linum tenue]|uniref:Uncharacterized protein n=2 Tax=Linum tenue TaxID=586396 RepID=A0AAV0K100_9ROSI|nr:unnamed protein product [Linum tenue]
MKNHDHRGGGGKGREKEEMAAARRESSRRAGTDDDAAVEELLRSAQDEIMLKLSVDSHISKTPNGSDSLPSDLRRRLDALKSVPASTSSAALKSASASSSAVASAGQSQDDLMARFDALKVKGRSGSGAAPVLPSPDLTGSGGFCTVDEDDEEDEVEKIIRWAKDAARLDPSPPSDDDDDCHSDDDDDGDVTE